MGVQISHSGNFRHVEKFLNWVKDGIDYQKELRDLCQEGVDVLASATPERTGLTAGSWEYKIVQGLEGATITYYNTNDQDGWFNVAIGLQYGHGTGTGGWVEGIDYINPALRPVFDKIAEKMWDRVRSA